MAAHDTNKWIGLSEESDTPTARNIAGPRLRAAPDLGDVPGLEFFFADKLQHAILQQRLRSHLLQLTVFPFELFESSRLVNLHLPELPLPPVEADLRDVLFATDIRDRLATVHCS